MLHSKFFIFHFSFFILHFHFLQQVACQFTQFTSFTFQQIDVCKDILVFLSLVHLPEGNLCLY